MDIIQTLAQELDKAPQHVENVVRLLDEGNTIPFIARYRKELHGAMDDASLRTLEERLQYLRGLEERREAVKRSIDEQGKLTDELAAAIDSAKTLAEVEDLQAKTPHSCHCGKGKGAGAAGGAAVRAGAKLPPAGGGRLGLH